MLHLGLACVSCVGLLVSTYLCYNDEMKRGRLNAVKYQIDTEQTVDTEETTSEEIKDKVMPYLDLDVINY